MLNGISPLITADLLADLHRMGHGDTLVLADAFFPAHRLGPPVHPLPGIGVEQILDAILPLVELDQYTDAPLTLMAAKDPDEPDPQVAASYLEVVAAHQPESANARAVERFSFYEMASQSFAIVLTGSRVKYANLIVAKGVTASP